MARKSIARHRRHVHPRVERGGRGLLWMLATRLAAAWLVDVLREHFDPSDLLG